MELINGRTAEEIKCAMEHCTKRKGRMKCNPFCPYFSVANCWLEVMRDAMKLIARLGAAQPRWISVEDNLPWMNKRVLVSDGEIVTEAYYNGRGEWIHNGYDMEMGGVIVTRWMPLPEPPKEGANG